MPSLLGKGSVERNHQSHVYAKCVILFILTISYVLEELEGALKLVEEGYGNLSRRKIERKFDCFKGNDSG